MSRWALAASAAALTAAVAPALHPAGPPAAGGAAAGPQQHAREAAQPAPGGPAGPGGDSRRLPARGPVRVPARVHGAAPAVVSLAAARRTQARAGADALTRQAGRVLHRLQAYRRWGLHTPPPVPPEPPDDPPRLRDAQVLYRVPTDDRVVFLTIDDGDVKDPEFLRMVRDLDLPVTSFLSDEEARGGAGYDYFRTLAALGGATQNHTLTHPYLPGLDRAEQRREICGQQRTLEREFGGPAPRLLRPPYGDYDADTLRAARECGVDGVVLWGMEAWPDRIDFSGFPGRLYPGAIILAHYRGPDQWDGTMADMTRRVLRLAAAQGYAVARLEDYV